ncbi:MAG: Coenzyme F420 hydrogenase/dehydrogenase, beta subunit C-terminal domain [Desulfobacterales bacterium]|nr:Coenzyme F420 hydrogenase/dehydrogenase, beta subunit C-terminal domain [Desulfobacterales bacterium]
MTTGMEKLKKEVIDQGLCVSCGACAGTCPHISYFDGKIIIKDQCDRDSGRCYEICPKKTEQSNIFSDSKPIGVYSSIHKSRAVDPEIRKNTQYGGTVTALLIHALSEGIIDGAILTSTGDNGSPKGILAKTKDQVISCAGSRYTTSASLEEFNKCSKEGMNNLGIVALPCQAQALSNIKLQIIEDSKSIGLVIGLFCTWGLSYRPFMQFLEQNNIKKPLKYDIPPPPANVFQIFTESSIIEFPLEKIRSFINKGCLQCPDLTAELSDISVGAMEGNEGWNTLIIRTEKGNNLIKSAVEKNIIQISAILTENFEHLSHASINKRKKCLINAEC